MKVGLKLSLINHKKEKIWKIFNKKIKSDQIDVII